MNIQAIDAHLHGDILHSCEEKFPDIYYDAGISGINWSYNERISSVEGYLSYWDQLRDLTHEFNKHLPFFYMVGIHPRTICDELKQGAGFSDVLKQGLIRHLKDPLCVGLGEIGLERGDDVEMEILRAHLDFASECFVEGKKIGIHTPRRDKERITEKILRVLEEYPDLRSYVLIEHVTLSTLSLVRDLEPVIGMTLQYGKTTPQDVQKIVEQGRYPIEKIILNSDSGRKISLPYLNFVKGGYVPVREKEMMITTNAIRFYGLDLST